jgi:hemagglutinin/hemolysin family protein
VNPRHIFPQGWEESYRKVLYDQYVRLDSYNPRTKEIVSRKCTQLSEISEGTAIRYLKELKAKYSPGAVIADVPSNRVGANAGIFEENGAFK